MGQQQKALIEETARQFVHGVYIAFTIALVSGLMAGSMAHAQAANQQDQTQAQTEIRLLTAISKFTNTRKIALALTIPTAPWLYSNRLEIAVGNIGNSHDINAFLSLGPLWRLPLGTTDSFIELGFSPTILADSHFSSLDIGGQWHFSSSVSLGLGFGKNRRSSLALSIQHLSNGGLSSKNPGLNTIGLSFTYAL